MERGAALLPGDGRPGTDWGACGSGTSWTPIFLARSRITRGRCATILVPRISGWIWRARTRLRATMRAREKRTCGLNRCIQRPRRSPSTTAIFCCAKQQYPEASAELQRAARADPSASATGDIARLAIERGHRRAPRQACCPPTRTRILQALDFFASIHRAQPGLCGVAAAVGLGKPFPLPRVFHIFRGADSARIALTKRGVAWREALAAAGLPHDEPPGNRNLVWNGNFRAGFREWRARLALDSADGSHDGG